MKKYTMITVILFLSVLANCQVLSPEVIASAGDIKENQGYLLSWTLGETIAETFLNDNNQVTQGFQQPYLYQISLLPGNQLMDQDNIRVFPNPAVSYFFVEIDAETFSGPLTMNLYNIFGVKVDESVLHPGSGKKKINISQYPSDMFILDITDERNMFIQTYKIIKVKM